MKLLCVVTASIESVTGLALIASPTQTSSLLLGTALDAPSGLVIARMTGAALIALSAACWSARDGGPSRANRGLVVALLGYNAAAVIVLAHARLGLGLSGLGLWPAVVLHTGLGSWCLASLRRRA